MFFFGGDHKLEATWAVRLPVVIDGNPGRLECFIVPGNTPILLGRPLLSALQVRVDYANNAMSLGGDLWRPLPLGLRGEHLIRLDDGDMSALDHTDGYTFDYITTDTEEIISRSGDEAGTFTLRDYFQQTETGIPAEIEKVMSATTEPNTTDRTEVDSDNEPSPEYSDEDDDLVRKEITRKLLRRLQISQNVVAHRQQQTAESMLLTYDRDRLLFWEVYSGDARLAEAMNARGYHVRTFDELNGWDFSMRTHRETFLQEYYRHLPDLVWLAPPCIAWSNMQNINVRTTEDKARLQARRAQEEKTHLRFVAHIFNKQYH